MMICCIIVSISSLDFGLFFLSVMMLLKNFMKLSDLGVPYGAGGCSEGDLLSRSVDVLIGAMAGYSKTSPAGEVARETARIL